MDTTISRPVRILALVGLLVAVAGGGGMLLLSRSQAQPAPAAAPAAPTARPPAKTPSAAKTRSHPAAARATSPAKATAKKHAHASATRPAAKAPAAARAHAHATTPAAKAKTAAKAKAKARATARRGNLVDARLPAPLQWQLSQHRIVVVALYDPHADVDAISVAEARAGAVDAHAGFLLVSVLDNAVAGPLTALLPGGGLLPDPGVLVYRAPGTLAFRLDGFNDRQSVAQAATNAAAGQSDPSGTDAPAATP